MFRLFIKISVVLIAFFTLYSCNSTEPDDKINLSAVDVSCTEVWLQITGEAGKEIQLIRDDKEIQRFTLTTSTMTVLDDSLQINTSYSYQVERTDNGEKSSIKTATLDTTSHDFTWETLTFGGDAGSSILWDVVVINENNIWAVGEIYIRDTSENGYSIYNAVHWDGNKWELKKIKYYGGCSLVEYPQLKAIWASENNIIITNGGSIGLFNGVEIILDCEINQLITGAINKIWGINSNDYYVVGNNGNIAHYQNGQWNKIESGTDVRLEDIYGSPDGKTIWVSGYEDSKPTVLLKISNSEVETVFSSRDYLSVFYPDHISGVIGGVWTNSNNFVYVTTPYSLYRKSIYSDNSLVEALRFGNPLNWLGRRSRGTDANNIFIAGDRGNVHHFNGITFKTYEELADEGVTYYSLDVRGNVAILCGQKYENGISDQAIITVIK